MSLLRALLLLCLIAAAPGSALAEQLPIKTYTTADGLVSDEVRRVFQDSHGFLWFCTGEGLSRFDGYNFTNYGIAEGLPHHTITDIVETQDGTYWIATLGGLVKYDPSADGGPQTAGGGGSGDEARGKAAAAPAPGVKFVVYFPGDDEKTRAVSALFKDRAGNIWVGTYGGLYRLEQADGRWHLRRVEIGLPGKAYEDSYVRAITQGGDDTLWVGAQSGLYSLSASGDPVARYTVAEGLPSDKILALLGDREGRVWAGTPSGLCQLVGHAERGERVVARLYTTRDGLIDNGIISLVSTAAGRLWVGTRFGLSVFTPAAAGARPEVERYANADGLADIKTKSLSEDGTGNVWVGTESGGAMRIARDGFVSYRVAEGLGHIRILSIFENLAGDLHVVSGTSDGGTNDQRFINHFDGRRFTAVRANLPGVKFMGFSWSQSIFQDHAGEWWVPTGEGLFRFPRARDAAQLARMQPSARYTTGDGLPGDSIFRLFEDSRGDIWISAIRPERDYNKGDETISPGGDMLVRWERATESFHRYTAADGVPQSAPTAFAEDATGNLWLGFNDGYLMRYRDGRFTDFTGQSGQGQGLVQTIYPDRTGRLWVAYVLGGVVRVDNPADGQPRFARYTTAEGLSSDQVGGVVEDEWGGIYVGTGRGVDRLDVAPGRIKHYTMSDGLIGPGVHSAYRDRHGTLWFATLRGLSRLDALAERASPLPAPVRISGVSVNGVQQSVSDLGETEMRTFELGADQNQIEIDFLGLGIGDRLRYQFMLEGAETNWSAPTENRTVNYLKLAPGSYRFLVRAVNAEGAASTRPASVAFTILPPVWRRWWFVALGALFVVSVVYALVRYRLARLRALRESENRFRTLAETASDAIVTINEESVILFVNPAAEKMFGYPAGEMNGARLTMLMPEYLRHVHEAGLNRYLRTGERHTSWVAVELPGLHRDGHEIPLEIAFGEFTKNDGRFFTGIARDITERRQAEEALRKNKEERLLELERVRTRIATDLHDDIGASLTQIVVLSEVIQQGLGRTRHEEAAPLSAQLASISHVSNELVEAMSDIVWAINPQKDHLSDLTLRMRRLASDLLAARQISLSFRAPGATENVPVGANVRREVFLIFKESINNIVRHSACTKADIEFRIEGEWLTLALGDNGRGFVQNFPTSSDNRSRARGGNGLANMRRRAREMGGEFEVVSGDGTGTIVTLRIPVGAPQPHDNGG